MRHSMLIDKENLR